MRHLGHSVTLLAPDVHNTVRKDVRSYYGIEESFDVVRLPAFDALRRWWVPGFLAFILTMRSYARSLRRWLREHPADLVYTRSPRLLSVLFGAGIPVVLELHTLPYRSRRFLRLCAGCRLIVCLTSPMRDVLLSWGVDARGVIVEGDGVDLRRFPRLSREGERAKWPHLPAKPTIVYVGSLVTRGSIEKGVSELLVALQILKQRGQSIFGWIIGGPREYIGRYRAEAQRLGLGEGDVRFEGPVHNARVPSALAASDVCVYPAPASSHAFFQRDTSPLKVFEYLASGRPTVCARIPPLEGVIDDSFVHFCAPGDASALAEAVAEALLHPKSNERLRYALLEHVSWEERMKRILDRAIHRVYS
jgi:glycosyltransferase involved in cell wall biosynthesis